MAVLAATSVPSSVAPAAAPSRAAGTNSAEDSGGFSFHDFLSIINPLQHIPVVSTLYRHFTGDAIKPLERLVGDTVYGGWMGFVSSVANLIFEKETGKDFGETVLAFFDGNRRSDSTAAAANATAATPPSTIPAPATTVSASDTTNSALANSLSGADPGLAQRAIYAYRRSISLSGAPEPMPAF